MTTNDICTVYFIGVHFCALLLFFCDSILLLVLSLTFAVTVHLIIANQLLKNNNNYVNNGLTE